MGFAVLHIAKGKGSGAGLGRHINQRQTVMNADPERSHLNFFVTHTPEGKLVKRPPEEIPLQQRIQERIKVGYTGKTAIRKDAVKFLNIVLSGSHEDMKKLEKEGRINEWAALNYAFIARRYGASNVVEFAVHLDERTPHAHAVVVPLTRDGRLCAKEIMGNKEQLSRLQEDYGREMHQRFNLNRGIKGSKAKHDTLQEYYGRINERMYNMPPAPVVRTTPGISLELPPPPRICLNPEEWAKNQTNALQEEVNKQVGQTLDQIFEEVEQGWKGWQILYTREAEHATRIRKQLAQIAGAIKAKEAALNQKLNPDQPVGNEQRSKRVGWSRRSP